jgi:hypothetical protein
MTKYYSWIEGVYSQDGTTTVDNGISYPVFRKVCEHLHKLCPMAILIILFEATLNILYHFFRTIDRMFIWLMTITLLNFGLLGSCGLTEVCIQAVTQEMSGLEEAL